MALTTAEELRLEGTAKTLYGVLVARFEKVPASVEKKLNAIQEPARFDKLTKLAATCKTLDDFKKAL